MSEASSPAPASSPAASAAVKAAPLRELADFHDRLSPMLVKELRQGLRAKTFISVFLALQGFLALVLLITAAASSGNSGDDGSGISKVIFFFFCIAALIVQPLRGIGALHSEIRGNTIELMVMTRLNAWRIVLGKWVSIVSQTGLLFVAVIPYLILRYFFGGMQLFSELLMIGSVFFLSSVFTAVTVGLSALPSVLIRGLLPLLAGALVMRGITWMTSGDQFGKMVYAFNMQDSAQRWALVSAAAGGAYVAWMLLGLAASLIAPAAENHSTVPRLVTLGALVVIAIVAMVSTLSTFELTLTLVLVIGPAVMLAISEGSQLLPPTCEAFLRKGPLGMVAGRFLYPGWSAGTLFSLLAIALGAGVWLLGHGGRFGADATIFLLSIAGTLLFPAVVLGLFHKKVKNRFAGYLTVVLISVIVPLVAYTIASSMASSERTFLWAFCWLPAMDAYLVGIGGAKELLVTQVAAGVTAIYGAVSLVFALSQFGKIAEVEEAARAYIHPETASPSSSLPSS